METLPVKPRILVVDDHPANLLAFEIVLEKDFSPYLAESGPQALELAERGDFSVILIDIRMPIMDGYETAIELRKREKTRHTPIIFTSAVESTPAQLLEGGLTVGAIDYLFTPVDPEFLRFKVSFYAQLHLQSKALQFQLDELSVRMRTLRAEIAKEPSFNGSLNRQIRQLEELSDGLKRHSGALESLRLASSTAGSGVSG